MTDGAIIVGGSFAAHGTGLSAMRHRNGAGRPPDACAGRVMAAQAIHRSPALGTR